MDKKKCFVIMPFSETTDKHTEQYWTGFYDIIHKIMENNNYDCKKSEIGPYDIFSHIVENIEIADIVIAVLTDYNANVWYELGIRHTLKSGTVMLLQDDQNVPFDIKSYGIILYKDSYDLKEQLTRSINSYINKINSKTCDSPVIRSLKNKKICNMESENNKIEKRLLEMQDLLWKIINEKREETVINKSGSVKHNRILWVDDYPSNNSAIMHLFENRNVHFDIAITTQQGIERFKNQSYDIIITDMGRNYEQDAGITLIKELNELNCKIPIIVFASYNAVKNYGKKALEYGASIVSCNPFDVISAISDRLGL